MLETNLVPNSIVDHDDYRDFLKWQYLELKKENSKFSLEFIAKKIGTTKGFINLVLSKKRHLSVDRMFKVATFFKLSPPDAQYLFFQLIHGTTKDTDGKAYFKTILASYRKSLRVSKRADFSTSHPSIHIDERSLLFKDWIMNAIYSLADFENFSRRPEWIQEKLGGETIVSLQEVEVALKKIAVLEEAGSINRLGQNADTFVDTNPSDFDDYQRFKVGLNRVAQAIDLRGKTDVHRPSRYHMYTLSLSHDEIQQVIALYDKLQADLEKIASASKGRDRLILVSNNIIGLSR